MPDFIINLIIILMVCGFVYWVYLKLMPLAPIAEPFKTVINVLVAVPMFAIILFYAIIPLLRMLPRMLH